MTKFSWILISGFIMISARALPATIEVGKNLPYVKVSTLGEVNLDGSHEKIVKYNEWDTKELKGKVRTIQAIAGRLSARKMNKAFIAAVGKAHFDPDNYQTATIVNLDDVIPLTGFLAKNGAEEAKKKHWSSLVVLDENGIAAKTWSLKPESSAIIILNKQGTVVFFKEGKMSSEDQRLAFNLIISELAKSE